MQAQLFGKNTSKDEEASFNDEANATFSALRSRARTCCKQNYASSEIN
jgi:hypothetical protein